MPELPEVEVTLRGIAPRLTGRLITGIDVREPRLRWRVQKSVERLVGRRIRSLRRRGKYILLDCGDGHLILHLGMSGSLRLLQQATPPQKHDHFDLRCGDLLLRLRDPRRFGAVLWTERPLESHPLLGHLGVEPLTRTFNGRRLHALTRGLRASIKQTLMDGRRIVGIGNIYASESLFLAGIRPEKAAGRVTRAKYARLAKAIRKVLSASIKAGGTTLRDFTREDGEPGYFLQRLRVYGREGEQCYRCGGTIKAKVTGQRSTYYCPSCQK